MKHMATMVLLIVLVCVCGCSTQSITQRHASQLAQLNPGMSLDEFRLIMPRAVPAGQAASGGQMIDAYEVEHTYMYDTWSGRTTHQRLWFYFVDKTLVKWGEPGDWPSENDVAIVVTHQHSPSKRP